MLLWLQEAAQGSLGVAALLPHAAPVHCVGGSQRPGGSAHMEGISGLVTLTPSK